MRAAIVAELERLAGNRLTPPMREEIADAAIRIVDDYTRSAALKAMETVKQSLGQGGNAAGKPSPKTE